MLSLNLGGRLGCDVGTAEGLGHADGTPGGLDHVGVMQ